LFHFVEEKLNRAILKNYDSHTPIRQQYIQLCSNFFRYLLVRDVCAGLFELDDDMIRRTVEACWGAV